MWKSSISSPLQWHYTSCFVCNMLVAFGREVFSIKKSCSEKLFCANFLLQFQHSPYGDSCTSTRSEPVCTRSVGWIGPCHRTSCIRGQVGCASTAGKWFHEQCTRHPFSRSLILGSASTMINKYVGRFLVFVESLHEISSLFATMLV